MAQLELSVVLNLANFRTQLGKLAQASAAYYYPVNLTIDKQAFRRQLAALGNVKPIIKIEDSQLDAARKRIGTLNKSLATLRRATSTPIEIKLKYVEVGKPSSAAAGQIGKAVSGGVRGSQALEGVGRGELLNIRKMMSEAGMALGKITSLSKATASELRASIVPAFTNSGEQAINGLAIGLKDSSSKIGKIAAKVGTGAVNGIKVALGIASPSRVFKQIGEFSVDGLELGFINRLKDFKTKAVAEIKSIVKSLRQEARVGMIAAGGLLSPVAAPRTASTRTIPGVSSPRDVVSNQDPGRSNNRILNSLSLLTGDPRLYRSRMANLGANRLPSSLLGSAATQMNLEEIAPSFKEARLGGTKTGVANIIDEAFFGRGTLPKASNALNALSNTIERLASSARAAAPSGILQSASGNPRFRAFGGVPSSQSMGIFPPTAQPTAYPPSGGFLEFSRRATAISAGLPGNVFGGRSSGDVEYPSSPVQSGQSSRLASPLGAGYFAVGKGLKGIESAYGQVKNFLNTKNLPVTGAIADLGSEFGNAIKQVLLFGTAYKALAFLTSLPREAFEAAKGLATYKNQLQAVTAESGTFEQSFAFVDGLATRFNVPLDSARQGFVKLYASMQPAGFDQGQIENLFTGISKAAAAFGLSSDKVDRVNYAFAQMASKGQIMSEELKGQLGDVLPGALGLFAKAAQMSIPEFSKAMEDGAFKGKAMEQVLGNVATLLNNKFGAAAEGAAKTLQGAVNQIQNNLALMYQSFSPIVDGVAAAFGPQVNALIKDVTDTVKVLTGTFTQAGEGFDTLSPRAQAFYAAIQTLRPSLEQAGAALLDLGGRLASLLPAFIQVIAATISFAASPLGRSALIAAIAVSTLTAALKLLEVTGIKAAIKAVYAFIGGLLKIPAATGVARVAVIGLKLALTGVFVGAILMGLDFLIGKLFNIGDAANDSANDIRGMSKELDAMAGAGDIEGTSKAFLDANTKLAAARKANQQALNDLRTAKARPEGDTQADILKGVAVVNAKAKVDKTYAEVIEAQKAVTTTRQSRKNAVALKEQQEKQTEQQLEKIDLSGEDEASKKKTSLESYYSLQDQLAKAQTQADIERLEAAFEHARAMINAEYDLKEAKANSFQKKAIAFQKEIFAITSEQDAALFKNRNKVLAAAGSVAGGAGAAMGGVVAMTGGAVSQDPLTRGRSSGPHLHAQAAGITEKTLRYLVDKYLEVGGKTASAFGQSRGSAGHGYNAIDFLTPQGTPIKLKPGASMSQYGAAGGRGGLMSQVATPEGSFQLGHLSSLMLGGQTGTGVAPGKVAPSIKRNELAEQQVTLTAREANASAVEKEAEAIAKLEIATANYVQSLVPTAEQALQNQLLQQRITLTQNSFSPEILEAQLAFAEQELQVAESIKINTEEINRLTAASGNNAKGIKALTDANNQLKANLPVSAIQLLTKAIDDQVLSLVQRTKTAGRDAADHERVNSLIIGGMTRQAAEAKVTAENLRSDYKKALEEATRQVEIAAAAEEVLAAARRLGKKETAEQTAEYNRLAQALKDAKDKKDALEGRAPQVEGTAAGIESSVAPKTTSSYIADGLSAAQEKLDQLTNTGYQVVQAANAIGDAFSTAFKGVITGSMTAREALAGMFQSVADHFADMVAQMIAEYLKMALIKGIMSIIGGAAGALGGGLSSGFNAGTSSAIDTGATGWANSLATPLKLANGGIAPGGFTAFANGGVVTGPTLGLVGEGRYNEAVIPLPDGKSVPVQLSGGDGGNQMNTNITVNVSNGQAQSNASGSNSSELGRKIEGAVKQVIVGELRPGGLLASR
jgi:tape measure domain-containing protein